MSHLDGRVALVTGAGGGIGSAICRRLSADGAFVVAADINQGNAAQVAQVIEKTGRGALGLHLDVTKQEEWRSVVAETLGKAGRLDILVNNAGVANIKP